MSVKVPDSGPSASLKFAASEILTKEGQVIGVATGDVGVAKDGSHKDSYQRGVELHGKVTLFAEGCHGSLTEDLVKQFNLRSPSADRKSDISPQTYGIGIKELWEVSPEVHKQGKITHTVGWPMDNSTYGGSFLYHLENNQVAVGFVVGFLVVCCLA